MPVFKIQVGGVSGNIGNMELSIIILLLSLAKISGMTYKRNIRRL